MKRAPTPENHDPVPALLAAALGAHPVAAVLLDPHRPGAPIRFCNQAFCTLTGHEAGAVAGRTLDLLHGPRTGDAALPPKPGAVRTAVSTLLWSHRRDGTAFWSEVSIAPLHDEGGTLRFLLGTLLDATDRRDAEEARRQLLRIDTLGAAAAAMTHEFNNLITVLLGSLETIGAETLSPRQRDRLDRAMWAAGAAGRLSGQMLSLAQPRALGVEHADLNRAIGDIDAVLAQIATVRIPLRVMLAAEPLPVAIDVGRFELALINLVRNAVDACGDGGGRIDLATRASGGGMAELTVRDTGSGMPPELIGRVTEPFFTTKPRGKGTGLGLPMVRNFVQDCGGTLLIESTPGQGTTIRILLPLAVATPEDAPRPRQPIPQPAGDKERP